MHGLLGGESKVRRREAQLPSCSAQVRRHLGGQHDGVAELPRRVPLQLEPAGLGGGGLHLRPHPPAGRVLQLRHR